MQPGNGLASQDRTFIEQARRAQIVQAAIDTIAEVGFRAASLARIAARSGISRGLISYHFTGKDDLIAEVLRTVYTDGAVYMGTQISREVSPAGQLRAYVHSNLEYIRDHPNAMTAVVEIANSGAGGDGLPGIDAVAGDRQVLAPLEDLFRAGQTTGEFREFDPTIMAVAVRGIIDSFAARLRTTEGLDLDRVAVEVVELVDLATRSLGGEG